MKFSLFNVSSKLQREVEAEHKMKDEERQSEGHENHKATLLTGFPLFI